MDFVCGKHRASILRAGDGWLITYSRPNSPVVEYEMVKTEEAALKAMRSGGWEPA